MYIYVFFFYHVSFFYIFYCLQVFVSNSGKNSELGHPFGYLKASSNLISVNLFIMPYNYPVLLPLLDDLFKVHRLKPSPMWRQAFENYLRDVPSYYAQACQSVIFVNCWTFFSQLIFSAPSRKNTQKFIENVVRWCT